jgi:hypothetical protein
MRAMSFRRPAVPAVLLVFLLAGCGSSEDKATTGAVSPAAGGSSGAGGSQGVSGTAGASIGGASGGPLGTGGAPAGSGGAGGGIALAGSGGAAVGGASGGSGPSGGTSGSSGSSGNTDAGASGSSGQSGGTAGAGGGAGGTGGTGLEPGCCNTTADCSTDTVCHAPLEGQPGLCVAAPASGMCWTDADCAEGMTCEGGTFCPCGTQCGSGTYPGTCVGLAAGQCRTGSDCESFQQCFYPGQSIGCGTCFPGEPTCASDADCQGTDPTLICEPHPCSCNGATECVAGCTAEDQCAPWEFCAPTHRCVADVCLQESDCPPNFVCAPADNPHCVRKICSSDADCADYCVDGQCYDTPGSCGTQPP